MSDVLTKNNEWSWGYDVEQDKLTITVITTDQQRWTGCTVYGAEELRNDALRASNPFTEEDSKAYHNFYERLEDFVPNQSERSLIAINATAVRRFHKKLALTDGYFQANRKGGYPEVGEIVLVATVYKGPNGKSQEGNFLIVDVEDDNCYGMLISNESIMIDAENEMKPGRYAHISKDRTFSISAINTTLLQTLNIA